MASTREIDGMSVVLLGSFNPAIFQPEWLARYELIAPEEADSAEVQIVSGEVTVFSTELFDVQVTHDQFVASTARVPSFAMLQDLVVGIFERLRYTPVTRMGINRQAHFRMPSEGEWHALGHRLAPPDRWSSFLKSPGMRTLVVQAMRSDDRPGHVFLRVEPSAVVRPGVYVQQNDHYELDDESEGTDQALELLRSDWALSMERAEEAFTRIFDVD